MSVLVQKSVKRTLFNMAFPMLAGMFAMNAYNLTDTWFVSRLGTLPLAAMGFTFPVVMFLSCVAGGLGVGTTILMSHATGRHDKAEAAKMTTHGLTLMLGVAALIAGVGYVTISPVFTGLGADSTVLPIVRRYMRIWYLGAPFMALPMLGNGLLISAGDSKTAGRFMMVGPIVNVILDPIMIFGYLGFPALGLRGAAQRIEMFAFVVPMALGIFLAPFVSQNLGAARYDRIRESFSLSTRFAMLYGGGVAVTFFLCAPLLASIFSRDTEVTKVLVTYFRIVSFGYGIMEVHRYCGITLTGLHKPISSALLNGIRVLVLLIPLSFLGAHFGGVLGVFAGRLATDWTAGCLGLIWIRYPFRKL